MTRTTGRLSALAISAGLVAALLTGCGTNGGGNTTQQTSTETSGTAANAPYRIGAIVSLTGSYAGLGVPEKNTLEMETAAINDAGGINGRRIELIVEDDATDNGKATAAASKLIDQENVIALIGPTGTGETMAIRGDLDRASLPEISMAGGNAVTQTFDKNVFQAPWPNRLVVPFVLKYIQGKGVKKVALLTDSSGYGKDGLAIIVPELAKLGMTAVANETFNPGDTDMTAQLTKIKASNPDAILLWSAGSEAATIMKNRQQLGITTPVYGGSGQARQEFLQGAGTAAEGFTFGTGKVLLPESFGSAPNRLIAEDFAKRYHDKYGSDPNIFTAHAYDSLHMIADAIKRIPGQPTPQTLRDEIEKTAGFVGLDGTFTFSPTDHNGLSANDLVMYRVTGGKWVLAK
jgi:branched-chain amino acid transport system substrate-binding protein